LEEILLKRNALANKKTIGILGGGQLARMSAYAAYRLGFQIAILEKDLNSPAGMMTKNDFSGWLDDYSSIKKFADVSDIITLENEFIDYKKLEEIESFSKKIIPSPHTISLIQDKLTQKETLQKNNIPVPAFIKIDEQSSYEKTAAILGGKFILKSRQMGYDGYGNYKVESENDFKAGIEKLQQRHSNLLAEEFINFRKELAVMVARTRTEIKIYPVVETIQKNHICHTVIAPAEIDQKLIKEAVEVSISAVESVEGTGIYGIELFLTDDDKILVNEMAPRPHNSGHYTIEACRTSQFENHIRSVLGLPLGSTEMVIPYAVMINLLGKKEGEGFPENISEVLTDPEIHFHLYGKVNSRKGRKMGHITAIGDNLNELIEKVTLAENKILN
jgi:5-(carboxyamino)imidazole ribonucleotide synthase